MKRPESELELPRLSESMDSPLAHSIVRLRERGPDVAELGSLASQLAVRGISVTSPPRTAPDISRAAWKKWALVGGGAASGLALWLASREPPPATFGAPALPVVLSAPVVAIDSSAPLAVRRSLPASPPQKTARVEAEPPPVVGDESSTPLVEGAPGPAAPELRPKTAEPNRPELDRARSEPSVAVRSGGAPTRSVVPADSSAVSAPTEIELLRSARLVLRQSPARALELVESHARAFPSGKLSQERELIAISALVALGRRTAALSRASRFEQSFPQSPYRKQIADLLR